MTYSRGERAEAAAQVASVLALVDAGELTTSAVGRAYLEGVLTGLGEEIGRSKGKPEH